MTNLALLRGINVGGKKKVEMTRLKALFESIGATEVRTYVNSGNVVFQHKRVRSSLRAVTERAIENEFGFPVRLVLRDLEEVPPGIWAKPIVDIMVGACVPCRPTRAQLDLLDSARFGQPFDETEQHSSGPPNAPRARI
jgi:hypothetical protein